MIKISEISLTQRFGDSMSSFSSEKNKRIKILQLNIYRERRYTKILDEHRYSAIGKHLKNDHGLKTIGGLTNNFSVLKKCNGKLDGLIYEIFFIKRKRPRLNTQSDSIRAKLFI